MLKLKCSYDSFINKNDRNPFAKKDLILKKQLKRIGFIEVYINLIT
jgi:hypothetical protein